MSDVPGTERMVPTGPMRETDQYTQLAMADALRRAVQEGQQFFAWTPGDVHAQRWGTESMQFAPSKDDPRKMLVNYGEPDRSGMRHMTVLERQQHRADKLLGDQPEPGYPESFNLDDPNIKQQLAEMVERKLAYGMQDYPDPKVKMGERGELIRKQMEALSQEYGAGGERRASHYSPRAVGYEAAYGPMEEHIAAILRRSNLDLPEVRDIPTTDAGKSVAEGSPRPLRGFEITPEIAQAAKRGFVLPYSKPKAKKR